jgi:signal transduction histidine kinase
MSLLRLSLLHKIWLSSSVALTALFVITGLLMQKYALEVTSRSLQEEVMASFQAYESLWSDRMESLASVAGVISSLPHVRAAFQTQHRPTIRDAAGEIWLRVSSRVRETAFFVVTTPGGETLASMNPAETDRAPRLWPISDALRERFPAQVSGFAILDKELYQLVLTPVYIDSASGSSLLCVLVTGYSVNHAVAQRLKESTGGSEFVFESNDRVFASTLNPRATQALQKAATFEGELPLVSDGVSEYVSLKRALVDLEGNTIGRLCIYRSFDSARQTLSELRRNIVAIWLAAILLGLLMSYALARRIVQPVRILDAAAAEVGRQNYAHRVDLKSSDELGRLGKTFNSMCESIQKARQELILQERISTIGRMASSIVHDLRNPLAAIYGGAEMMVDTNLTPQQARRVAANIYRSSRRIQEMLDDLLQVTRGRSGPRELCRLDDLLRPCIESFQAAAAAQNVTIDVDIPSGLEILIERRRMERVFQNLVGNAIEVLPGGGEILIQARTRDGKAEIEVSDTGPGIAPDIRGQLFQPFVSHGKKNGLGLGLALSRQTVLEHGGEMWAADREGGGASFKIRLPLAVRETASTVS